MANSRSENLRFINIPGQDVGGGEGVRIEVTPADDQWLLSKDRKWDEVSSVLEGRLLGIQSQLTDFVGEPGPLARSYGLEKPVSGNMARLLAYTGMIDEYRLVEDSHKLAAEKEREAYESEKEQLKQHLKPSSGKYQKAIAGLQEKYEPELSSHSNSAREALGVRDLILRKAVVDIFSVSGNSTETGEPLIAQQFLKLFGEAETITERGSSGFKSRDPVEYFVDVLGKYLTSTNDVGLFVRYAYRNSPEIIRNLQDCTVLENVLEMAVGKSSTGEDIAEYTKLGKSCLDFLVHRASYLSSTGVKDTYPHLSLLYDLITTAGYGNSFRVLKGVNQVVDSRYVDLISSSVVRKEIKKMASRMSQYQEVADLSGTGEGMLVALENFATSPEYLLMMMFSMNQLINNFQEHLRMGQFKSFETIRGVVNVEANKVSSLLQAVARKEIIPRVLRLTECSLVSVVAKMAGVVNFPTEVDVLNDSTLRIFNGNSRSGMNKSELMEKRTKAFERLSKLGSHVTGNGGEEFRVATGEIFLTNFFGEKVTNVEELLRENGYLWNEISSNCLWFVSPRGDRFLSDINPELKKQGIDSLTFRIDRDKPREYKVEVRVTGFGMPVTFWLDTERNLLDEARKPIVTDPMVKESFANLVFKRLFTITSGLLSDDTDRIGEPMNEEGRDQVFRRAHYRKIVSTERRKITMESHGAQIHAKLIKEIYGIDIFAEIKRRRAIGSLGQDQYLTFVQESSPKFRGNLMLPNELKYDPTLINIPE